MFFANICSTHNFDSQLRTAGLQGTASDKRHLSTGWHVNFVVEGQGAPGNDEQSNKNKWIIIYYLFYV